MDMTNRIFQEPRVCLEKRREALEPDAGQPSRAIIPGDDPGDQQPPGPASIRPSRGRGRTDLAAIRANRP